MQLKIFSVIDPQQEFLALENIVNTWIKTSPGIIVHAIATHKDGISMAAAVTYTQTAPVVEADAESTP